YRSREATVLGLEEPTCAHKVFHVIRVLERAERNRLPRIRRMDEAPIARVDAHVIHLPLGAAEEHEVAGLEIGFLHVLGRTPLISRGSRHFDAEALVAVEHEAAAIEAALRIVAAEAIRLTEHALRDPDDFFALSKLGLGRLRWRNHRVVRPTGLLWHPHRG